MRLIDSTCCIGRDTAEFKEKLKILVDYWNDISVKNRPNDLNVLISQPCQISIK